MEIFIYEMFRCIINIIKDKGDVTETIYILKMKIIFDLDLSIENVIPVV